MLIEVMRMRIMNNEKKFQDAEKEAGGDEKLIFKFAWPYDVSLIRKVPKVFSIQVLLVRGHYSSLNIP